MTFIPLSNVEEDCEISNDNNIVMNKKTIKKKKKRRNSNGENNKDISNKNKKKRKKKKKKKLNRKKEEEEEEKKVKTGKKQAKNKKNKKGEEEEENEDLVVENRLKVRTLTESTEIIKNEKGWMIPMRLENISFTGQNEIWHNDSYWREYDECSEVNVENFLNLYNVTQNKILKEIESKLIQPTDVQEQKMKKKKKKKKSKISKDIEIINNNLTLFSNNNTNFSEMNNNLNEFDRKTFNYFFPNNSFNQEISPVYTGKNINIINVLSKANAKAFFQEKERLEKKALLNPEKDISTKIELAFHGTKIEAAKNICSTGFVKGGGKTKYNQSIPISHGSACGNGIYVSRSINFAFGYSNSQALFICAIVRGEETVDHVSKNPNTANDQVVLLDSKRVIPVFLIL